MVTAVVERSSANPIRSRRVMLEVVIFGLLPLEERCMGLGDMQTTEIGGFRSYMSSYLPSRAGRMDLRSSIVWIERSHQDSKEP